MVPFFSLTIGLIRQCLKHCSSVHYRYFYMCMPACKWMWHSWCLSDGSCLVISLSIVFCGWGKIKKIQYDFYFSFMMWVRTAVTSIGNLSMFSVGLCSWCFSWIHWGCTKVFNHKIKEKQSTRSQIMWILMIQRRSWFVRNIQIWAKMISSDESLQ